MTNLAYLPNLISLSLNDPMSSANPIGFLANYTTYILYHLPWINHLDSFDMSQELKKCAEVFYFLYLNILLCFCNNFCSYCIYVMCCYSAYVTHGLLVTYQLQFIKSFCYKNINI